MNGEVRTVLNPVLKASPTTTPTTDAKPETKQENKPEFKAAVGLSRKWDAREAGREVARDTLEKLGKDPDFFLLFSTIHYEKHGGFKEFLKGVWEILPEGTPLIGGTVAGFINPEGCYTRGATALAVSYPHMDVAIGIGHNTKRTPIMAAKECAKQIKTKLENTQYPNSLVISMISGGLVPKIPFYGLHRVFPRYSGLSNIILKSLSRLLPYLQFGSGREDEIWSEIKTSFPESSLIGASCMDNLKMVLNYQFFRKEIHENSIVAICISTNILAEVMTTHCMKETDIEFIITSKSKDGRIIHEINNKPATQELFKLLSWPEEYLSEQIYRRGFYYPIGFKDNGVYRYEVFGSYIGDSLLGPWKITDDSIKVFTSSGKSMIDSIRNNIYTLSKNKNFYFGVSCATQLETLGNHAYAIHPLLKNTLSCDFILLFAGGELTYSPSMGENFSNETFNSSSI